MKVAMKTAWVLGIALSLFTVEHSYAQYGGGGGQYGGSGRSTSLADLKSNSQPSDKLIKALADPIEVELIHQPLNDIAAFVSELKGIPVRIDTVALSDLNITEDTEISLASKKLSIEQCLKLVLEPLELDFVCSGDVLTITTKDVAEETMYISVRDVSELMRTGGYQQDGLIELLQQHIPGAKWKNIDGTGGTIRVDGNVLILTQNFHTHSEVESLLTKLSEEISKQENSTTYITIAYRLDRSLVRPNGLETPGFQGGFASGAEPVETEKSVSIEGIESKLGSVIQDLIAPDSWKQGSGTMKTLPGMIVVKQTETVHREIRKFLEPMLLKPTPPSTAIPGMFGGGMGNPAAMQGGFGGVPAGQTFYQVPAQ